MKALIIGAAGFVGGYLIRELKAAGWEVHATCLPNENINEECSVHHLDILKKEAIPPLLDDIKPDVVYHLAAQSSVSVSWKRPQLTAEVNVIGSINVLESVRDAEKKDIRLILIGSGEEYGYIREGACPLSESEPLNPGNIYAATKACQGIQAPRRKGQKRHCLQRGKRKSCGDTVHSRYRPVIWEAPH